MTHYVNAVSGSPSVPNDPRYSSQWNLQKIGAPAAWPVTAGTSDVVVAVIDTGTDYNHPDLAPNMWRNPGETGLDASGSDKSTNGIDDDHNGYVDDLHGINAPEGTGDPMEITAAPPTYEAHGTECAGVIGAVGDNQLGLTGVNWRVGIMGICVGLQSLSTESIDNNRRLVRGWRAAFEYLVMMKARGINIVAANVSIRSHFSSIEIRDALSAAARAGIVMVFTAGNSSENMDNFTLYPAGYNIPELLMVAGSGRNDALAPLPNGNTSNYGKSSVHLAAPALDIISTGLGMGYVSDFNGTSAAAPHVTAAAALLAAAVPGSSSAEIRAALLHSVDQPIALHGRLITDGRLNLGRALQMLQYPSPLPIVLAATPSNSRANPASTVVLSSSVWYRWTAQQNGWRTFELANAAFDTLLALYKGDGFASVLPIASNDNYGTRQASRLSFDAQAGAVYSVVVAGQNAFNNSANGPFTLSWYPTPPPGFTSTQFTPSTGAPGDRITLIGTNFAGATAVLFNGSPALFSNAPTNKSDLRIATVVPPAATSGLITIVTPHGTVTTTHPFQVLPPSLAIVLKPDAALEITWPATSDAFVLVASDRLDRSTWDTVSQPRTISATHTKVGVPVAATARFYRLRSR